MLAAITSIVTVVVTATGGVLAVVLKARADKQAAINPDWATFAESLQRQIDSQREDIASQDKKIASQSVKIDDLQAEQKTIRTELKSVKARYYTALDHIKDLRQAMARARNPPPPLPEELQHDLH